jgi:hypothetical protein
VSFFSSYFSSFVKDLFLLWEKSYCFDTKKRGKYRIFIARGKVRKWENVWWKMKVRENVAQNVKIFGENETKLKMKNDNKKGKKEKNFLTAFT